MAATVTLNQALEIFGKLSAEDQDMMLEIARKRRIESWRKETAAYGKKAVRDFQTGKLKAIGGAELKAHLKKLWEEENA
jgi:hypothetical protein